MVHFVRIIEELENFPVVRHLRLRLAPGPRSTLLNDLRFVGCGNLNIMDCWNAIENCYEILVRSIFDLSFDKPGVLPVLVSLTFFDNEVNAMKEIIDKLMLSLAPGWEKSDNITWRRSSIARYGA